MTSPSPPGAPATLYGVAYRKWKQGVDDLDAIDRKAFNLFTLAATALTAGLAVVRFRVGDPGPLAPSGPALSLRSCSRLRRAASAIRSGPAPTRPSRQRPR